MNDSFILGEYLKGMRLIVKNKQLKLALKTIYAKPSINGFFQVCSAKHPCYMKELIN